MEISSYVALDVLFPANAKCTCFFNVNVEVEQLGKVGEGFGAMTFFDAHHFAPLHNELIIVFS